MARVKRRGYFMQATEDIQTSKICKPIVQAKMLVSCNTYLLLSVRWEADAPLRKGLGATIV